MRVPDNLGDKYAMTRSTKKAMQPHTHRLAVSLTHACKHLGIAMDTLIYCINRGDFQVERDEDGDIVGVHLD